MKSTFKYMPILFLAIIFPICAQLAEWAYVYFKCQGSLKSLQPCIAYGVNILPFLGFGLFWCKLLWVPALPISIWLFINTYRTQRAAKSKLN